MQKKPVHKGHLEIICGPMFSGKSEELIRRLRRATIAQKKTICFNPGIDTRTPSHSIASHNGSSIKAITVTDPLHIPSLIPADVTIIGLDEIQFFSHDIVSIVFDLIEDGKHVIAAGLNLDFRGVPFSVVPLLLAVADTITKLSAICVLCGKDAYFSQRIINGQPAKYDDEIVKPGAEEAYQARCRSCHFVDKKPVWQKTL